MSVEVSLPEESLATHKPSSQFHQSSSSPAPSQSLLTGAPIADMSPDPFFRQILDEAASVLESEPELGPLLRQTVLAPGVTSFEDAVAATVCHRLLLHDHCDALEQKQHGCGSGGSTTSSASSFNLFAPNSCRSLIRRAFDSDVNELGHTMSDAVRDDVVAVVDRDPAMDTYLEVVLFSKGFAALVCHRAAHRLWKQPKSKKFTALYLQSQASALFGVDLHPLAQIGSGVLLDHGTGIVVGETAAIGDGCTILHGVTLGGTGKDHGDRHPKVGKHVLIGAGSSILGNIHIGDSAKIGAGSVVLRSIPPFATAVGAPAKIIGRTVEADPAHDVDLGLLHVDPLKTASRSVSTAPATSSDEGGSDTDDRDNDQDVMEEIDVVNMTGNEPRGSSCRLLKKKQSDCFSLCPYREYRSLARRAPRGTVTFYTLSSLLKPMGATGCEIGAAMFELDKDGVGYRCLDDELEDHARGVFGRCTRLSPEDTSFVVSKMLRQLEEAQQAQSAGTPIRDALGLFSVKAKDVKRTSRFPHLPLREFFGGKVRVLEPVS